MKRNRFCYFLVGAAVVALGLASRRYAGFLPTFLALYAGDTLWALMVFIGVGFLFPRWPSLCVLVAALLFSYTIEVSQLYHAQWIDGVRHTRLGGLILGYSFLWSDVLCYTVGAATGAVAESAVLLARGPRRPLSDGGSKWRRRSLRQTGQVVPPDSEG